MAGRPKAFDPSEALMAATDHFWSHGYEAAGMQSLVDAMGLNRQSAYDTFGSKRDLFLKALRQYLQGLTGKVGTMLLDTAVAPMDRIHGFLNFLVKLASSPSRGCLLTNTIVELAPHDEEIHELASATLAKLEDALAGVLNEAKRAGDLASDADARGLARLIVLTFEGGLVVTKTSQAGSVTSAVKTLKALMPAVR